MIRVTFHGGVRSVTGSLHQIEAGGTRVYLDCGLFQGPRAEANERNRRFPSDPKDLDAVILSHAHLDHCGNLPTLAAQGFRGRIYCTPATRDLTALVLRDSAKVQEQDIRFVNKIRRRQGLPEVEVLYDARAAERAIAQIVSIPYEQKFTVGGITAMFYDAGHILGSVITVLEAEDRHLAFTGDLGRPSTPIVRDPQTVPAVDCMLIESTYGDRTHPPLSEAETQLAAVVSETIQRGGKVLIPSFAMGRTQEVVYALHRQQEAGRGPDIPTYVDSPMATDATEIFRVHADCFDDELRSHLEQHDPFGFKDLHYVRTPEESRALNDKPGSFIVIATSGMVEAGRILHHLRSHIGDPRSTLLFVGYQAEGTLGRRLLDGAKEVRIYGEPHRVSLQVRRIEAFSAHADRNELLGWVQRTGRIGRAFCVHGEPGPATALAQALSANGTPASVPSAGQTVDV
ncbi:MAG: MBL fold metallo-hydrolase [Armatimonadota bacterium]